MEIHELTIKEILYLHWLKRKREILEETNHDWKGKYTLNPNPLHVAIGDILTKLSPDVTRIKCERLELARKLELEENEKRLKEAQEKNELFFVFETNLPTKALDNAAYDYSLNEYI